MYYSEVFSDYGQAVANTKVVGKQVANFIQNLNDHFGTKINNRSHLIGHSLGAHVAGYAGMYWHGNLSRITGKSISEMSFCSCFQNIVDFRFRSRWSLF